MLTGRVDGVILHVLAANGYANDNPDFEVVDVLDGHESQTAIAFPQGSALTEQVNEVLAELEADGTMTRLVEYWMINE